MKPFSKVTFTDYEKRVVDGRAFFYIKTMVETPNGEEHFHIQMPADTLEWRAAEYGIDHTDRDQLWDITLAEFFMNEEDYADQPQLYTHMDMDEVKQAHIGRCAKVKWAMRLSTRGKDGMHAVIKSHALIHPEAVDMKRRHVATLRAEHVPKNMMKMQASTQPEEQSHEERMQYLRYITHGSLEENSNG